MRALRESGYDVAAAADGTGALELLGVHDCDLLVLDLVSRQAVGNPTLEALRAQGVATPVLIVTSRALPEFEARVGLLLRTVNGQRPAAALKLGPLEVDRERRIALYAGTHIDISPRECELLAVLLESPGLPVSRDRIIAAMNERGHYTAENAIEVCVHRLRRKLGPGAVRIVTARGFGYCIALEPRPAAHAKDTTI